MTSREVVISPTSYFGPLHNDYPFNQEIDGQKYQTVTHYVYSQMVPDETVASFVSSQIDAETARKKANGYLFGKVVKGGDRKVPEGIATIMMAALQEAYKTLFSIPQLKSKLAGTGQEMLVYTPEKVTFLPGDPTYLGVNRADNGQNKLGELLMMIRRNAQEDIYFRDQPAKQRDAKEELYRLKLRRDLLVEQLNLGHFPADYSLVGLYANKYNLPADQAEQFISRNFSPGMAEAYWKLHLNKAIPEVSKEFTSGYPDWIEYAYDLAMFKYALMIEYLKFTQVDYSLLLLSLAKKKILNDYAGRRFTVAGNKTVPVSLEEYLEKNQISKATLKYIGEEALTDFRNAIYLKYKSGKLSNIPNFEENVSATLQSKRSEVNSNIKYPRVKPSVKIDTTHLYTEQEPLEPSSPKLSYGGKVLKDYYDATAPEGACSTNAEDLCPLGPGDEDEPEEPEEEADYDPDYDGADDVQSDREEYEEENKAENPLEDGDAKYGDNEAALLEVEDRDILQAIEAHREEVPVKRVEIPLNAIRFASEKDFPYEWLSPYYRVSSTKINGKIVRLKINGVIYPTVAHYVIARIATPRQFRNVSPRQWIQADYNSANPYLTVPFKRFSRKSNPLDPDMSDPDWLKFRELDELVQELPKRIESVYNTLFLRYSRKALDQKIRQYPFRQILSATGNRKIVYYDDEIRKTAVAGKQLAEIFEQLRNSIDDIALDRNYLPDLDRTRNLVLHDFVVQRVTELVKSILLFSKYKSVPRPGYVSAQIDTVNFKDAHVVLYHFYQYCRDIDYSAYFGEPPQLFKGMVGAAMEKNLNKYWPGKNVLDLGDSSVKDTIRAIIERKSEDLFTDQLFVDLQEITILLWIHCVTVCKFLEEPLEVGYNQKQLQKRIETLRTDVFSLPSSGSTAIEKKENAAVGAVVGILNCLRPQFRDTQLHLSDVEFVRDFLFPVGFPPVQLLESESSYPLLVDRVTRLYSSQQPIELLKKLASIVDTVVRFPKSDKANYGALILRVKFFAQN